MYMYVPRVPPRLHLISSGYILVLHVGPLGPRLTSDAGVALALPALFSEPKTPYSTR